MVTFEYTAHKKGSDELVKAEVEAESERAAAKLLMNQGLFPISIETKDNTSLFDKAGIGKHVRAKDRIIFTRQLSTLINAGLPLAQSLRTVQEQMANKTLKEILAKVVASVESGKTLSAAFAEFPDTFNTIYVSLVAAGEASGTLDKTLERLASQQEKDAAILSKIRSALVYPIIVLGVIVAVLIFMLTTVLPQVGGGRLRAIAVSLGQPGRRRAGGLACRRRACLCDRTAVAGARGDRRTWQAMGRLS